MQNRPREITNLSYADVGDHRYVYDVNKLPGEEPDENRGEKRVLLARLDQLAGHEQPNALCRTRLPA